MIQALSAILLPKISSTESAPATQMAAPRCRSMAFLNGHGRFLQPSQNSPETDRTTIRIVFREAWRSRLIPRSTPRSESNAGKSSISSPVQALSDTLTNCLGSVTSHEIRGVILDADHPVSEISLHADLRPDWIEPACAKAISETSRESPKKPRPMNQLPCRG